MIENRKFLLVLSAAVAFLILSGSSCDDKDPEPQPKPEPYWEIISIENVDQALNDVYFAGKFTGWIVGDSGLLIKTTDEGESWEINHIADENLNDFYSMGDTSFWIVGDNGLIMHSDDEGNTWQIKGSPVTANFNSVFMLGNQGWIAGVKDDVNGIIINTNNGGQSWNWQLPPENTKGLNDIYFMTPQRGFAVGDFGWMLKTVDGGNQWDFVNSGSKYALNAIAFISDTLGYVVGDFGDYLRSYDRGESWRLQYPTFWEDLKDIQFINNSFGWVVGYSSASYRTTDAGLNWQYQGTSVADIQINAVCLQNEIYGWAVGTDGFGKPVVMKPER